MQPRVIRLRDAPKYLGMDINRFNKEVRPFLHEFSVGIQGIGFDRLDLDIWFDDYKKRNGRIAKENKKWEEKQLQGSTCETISGISIKLSKKQEFAKALEQVTGKKRKSI